MSNAAFLTACIEAIGPSQILFGSDYPHFDANTPVDVENLPVSDEVKRQILVENARNVFGKITSTDGVVYAAGPGTPSR
jgi:predicted TIM-barrel fold metal-dependent hydrolase